VLRTLADLNQNQLIAVPSKCDNVNYITGIMTMSYMNLLLTFLLTHLLT